jgi:hypothetical protein
MPSGSSGTATGASASRPATPIRLKVSPNARQIDEPIDLAQHVIARHVPFQAEAKAWRCLHSRRFSSPVTLGLFRQLVIQLRILD